MTLGTFPMSPGTRARLRAGVEDFLYAEAALLDAGDFQAWFALFAPDAHYWIPAGMDDSDPTRKVSVVYDDLQFLGERVWRAGSGMAYAQEPASRTSHLVSNVQVLGVEAAPRGELVRATAAFIVTEFRRDVVSTHAGRYAYELLASPEAMSIRLKKVLLVNNNGRLGNLSLLL